MVVSVARVLLAFSNLDVRASARGALERAGHAVAEETNGPDALAAARRDGPDVVLTEVDLPGHRPFELVRELGPAVATRVIVVSARTAEADRIVAFELGADDYVPQPFSVRELVLRVAAVLRSGSSESLQRVGDLVIDRAAARASVGGATLALTRAELAILVDLVDARGGVRTRVELLRDALRDGDAKASERAIDSHVKRLRAKLGASAGLVETVTGVGYRLAIPCGSASD
jgi:DNA-binding response OmpR family regulator